MALISCTNTSHAEKLYFDFALSPAASPPWTEIFAVTSFPGSLTTTAVGVLAAGDRYGNLIAPLPTLATSDLDQKMAARELTAIATPVSFATNVGVQVSFTDQNGTALASPSGSANGGSAVLATNVFAKIALLDTSPTAGVYRGTLYVGRNHSIEV